MDDRVVCTAVEGIYHTVFVDSQLEEAFQIATQRIMGHDKAVDP